MSSESIGRQTIDQQLQHEVEIRQRDQRLEDQAREIAILKASLAAYAEDAAGSSERGSSIKDSRIAMKSRISGLQVQTDGQAEAIRKLRAETSGLNEQLARQAQHFMEEIRRLGAGTLPAAGSARRAAAPTDRKAIPLTQRITEAKPELSLGVNAVSRPVLVRSGTATAPVPVPAIVPPAETPVSEQPSAVTVASEKAGTDAVAFANDGQSDGGNLDATHADVAGETVESSVEPGPARPAVARPRLIDRLTDYGKA